MLILANLCEQLRPQLSIANHMASLYAMQDLTFPVAQSPRASKMSVVNFDKSFFYIHVLQF